MKTLENIDERGIPELGMKLYSAYTQVLFTRPVTFKINNVRIIMLIDDE